MGTIQHDNYGFITSGQPQGVIEHVIQGKLVYSELRIDFSGSEKFTDDDQIKKLLMDDLKNKLIDHMWNNKLISFTKQSDNNYNDQLIARARCFMVPDDQVRLLRAYNIY